MSDRLCVCNKSSECSYDGCVHRNTHIHTSSCAMACRNEIEGVVGAFCEDVIDTPVATSKSLVVCPNAVSGDDSDCPYRNHEDWSKCSHKDPHKHHGGCDGDCGKIRGGCIPAVSKETNEKPKRKVLICVPLDGNIEHGFDLSTTKPILALSEALNRLGWKVISEP